MALQIKKKDPIGDFFKGAGNVVGNIGNFLNQNVGKALINPTVAAQAERVKQDQQRQLDVLAKQGKITPEQLSVAKNDVSNRLKSPTFTQATQPIVEPLLGAAATIGDAGTLATVGLKEIATGKRDDVTRQIAKDQLAKDALRVVPSLNTLGNAIAAPLAERDLKKQGIVDADIYNAINEQTANSGLSTDNPNWANNLNIAGSAASIGLGAAGVPNVGRVINPAQAIKGAALKEATKAEKVIQIPTSKLTAYEDTSPARVAEYKARIENGGKIDPIIAMRDSKGNLGVEDGKHRLEALRQLGIDNADVVIANPRALKAQLQAGSIAVPSKPKVSIKEASSLGKAERLRADKFAETTIKPSDRAKDFIASNITDDTAYFQKLDREAAKAKGIKVRDTPSTDSLDAAIQSYRYAPSIQTQRYKDLGVNEFAKKLSNQADYDTYRVYRTFKTASERAATNTKPGESIEQAYSRFTGGRDFNIDRQATINVDAAGDKFNKLFQEEVGINRNILRGRGADKNLTMTPEDAEGLIKKYPNYTPLSREASEDVAQFQRSGKIGSQQGANVKKLKEGSNSRPIEDPLTALMANADELVKKGQANKVANIIVRDHGVKLRPMVTEADIIAKEKAIVSMAELGRDAKEVSSALRNNKALAGKLAQQIRQAEQAGNKAKVTLKQDPNQVTLKLANMTDNQFRRLSESLTRQSSEYDNLLGQIDLLRKRADDIKSDKAGIIRSGDLAAFESNSQKNVLRRVINGREEVYEVTDARLAQNLANLSGHELSQAAKVLGVPTRIFKFFTTGPGNVVGFAPIALTRDILGTILFAKAPIRSIADPRSWIDAFKASVGKGELFEEISRRGIAGTSIEGDRAIQQATSSSLRNTGGNRLKVYAKHPGQVGRDLENFEMGTERFSRARVASAQYHKSMSKYAKDPTLTPEQAKDMAFYDAAQEYREAMLNFGRGGKVTRELNSVVAYLNPAVQAGNKFRRTFRENPFGAAVRSSVVVSLLAGGYAMSNASAEQKEIYNEISEDDKRNNLILVPPNAKRNPDTGLITGVIKIPLPQEYAVFSDAVKGMYEGAEGDNYGDIALSGLAALTGLSTQSGNELIGQLLPSQLKPVIENAADFSFFTGKSLTPDYLKESSNGDKTKQFTSSTSGTAKAISRASGGKISPIEAENLIRGATGGASKDILSATDQVLNKTGAISDEETTSSNPFDRINKRYTQAYGKSEAVKFFDTLDGLTKTLPNADDRKAFELLHEKNSSPGILDSVEKSQIYLSRPDVVKKERELNDWNKDNGKPANPLFDLSDTELQKVLAYRSAKMLNAGKQTYDKNGNSLFTALGLDEKWYDDFRTNETAFYDKVSTKTDDVDKDPATFSGAKKPEATPEIQAKLDQYYTLAKGTGARSSFLRANPDVLAYWEQGDGFTNAERAAIGLKPLEDEATTSSRKAASDSSRDAYKYAVSLSAGGEAPKSEKNKVKARKISKVTVSNKGKSKPKVSIRKSTV